MHLLIFVKTVDRRFAMFYLDWQWRAFINACDLHLSH
jgi:hypothetical protein